MSTLARTFENAEPELVSVRIFRFLSPASRYGVVPEQAPSEPSTNAKPATPRFTRTRSILRHVGTAKIVACGPTLDRADHHFVGARGAEQVEPGPVLGDGIGVGDHQVMTPLRLLHGVYDTSLVFPLHVQLPPLLRHDDGRLVLRVDDLEAGA